MRLPGGGEVGLYQPKHPTAFTGEKEKTEKEKHT